MAGAPLLDQVSSQALTRLAAERGLTPQVTPAGEQAVPQPRRTWKRWLPYFFLGLSLFSLWGMAFGLLVMGDDGWDEADAIQLALLALLVAGVLQQTRGMVRPTRLGRWLAARLPSRPADIAAPASARAWSLDAVSADAMAAIRPAAAPGVRLRSTARRAGNRWVERVMVVSVVVLAFLAFAGMVFVCGYIAWESGLEESALWLTLPFTGLSALASYQIYLAARRSAFRGRTWALLTRAFRDSVRVSSSGSLATSALFTTTATASVTAAVVVPAFLASVPFDLFLMDSTSGAAYRVDIATLNSIRLADTPAAFTVVGVGSINAGVTLPGGKELPRGSILAVVEAQKGVQELVGFRPGSRVPIPIARLGRNLSGAAFTGGGGGVYALQPDRTLWSINVVTGGATRVGTLAPPVGPIAFDTVTRSLVLLESGTLYRIDPASGTTISSTALTGVPARACGIALAERGRLFVAEESTGRLFLVNTSTSTGREVTANGELPPRPCLMTVALRK